MDFPRPKPRRTGEPALPMINVVFLLLIFFLMSAQIGRRPPINVSPPLADTTDPSRGEIQLHISETLEIVFEGARGPDVWTALEERSAQGTAPILIRADAALAAQDLATVLARLSALGFEQIQLATARQ